ncbi:spindle assembly abnormal protein 6 homolog isoform X2 [Triplophysa rosa]|uniref:spindle assembly abnormal protein 6 homolog isoform X2 n=1 Tax=Triplophysa rosa TaxID=992332 RepID=UPI002545C31D|nr:spindle assembly abnormal protein 6 homolog isoform X2 [Triplophysa rosa]
MARARTKKDDESEPLLGDDEDEDTDNHGSFSNEANSSRGGIKTFRLMVLGSDEVSMNQACAAILGLPQRENVIHFGACILKEGQINGRQVSLVKTPSYWLGHLNSFLFFSRRVQSLRSDMEFCESIVFPGPHAFLLVLRDESNSAKEHLLLQALCDIYGKEVLDYCMVLFVHHLNRDILNNRCVKKCRQRYHILENTENNVPNLLKNIENMSNLYRTRYFTKHVNLLENAKKYFQTELNKKHTAMERSLKGELSKIKITVKDSRNEITELKRQNDELHKELDDAQVIEKQLRRGLDDAQVIEKQLRRGLDDSRGREKQLSVDNMKLQSQIKDTEKGLGKTNTELQVKETELCKRQRDLHNRERNVESEKRELETRERDLTSRERELESKLTRERDLAQRNTWSGGSKPVQYIRTADPPPADNARPLDKETGAESSDGDSQVTRSDVTDEIKPVRRNSLPEPPNMSESSPLHTL